MDQFALFYKPPCGRWYVHSHKLYPSVEAAEQAARAFLHFTTPFAVLFIDHRKLALLERQFSSPPTPAPEGERPICDETEGDCS